MFCYFLKFILCQKNASWGRSNIKFFENKKSIFEIIFLSSGFSVSLFFIHFNKKRFSKKINVIKLWTKTISRFSLSLHPRLLFPISHTTSSRDPPEDFTSRNKSKIHEMNHKQKNHVEIMLRWRNSEKRFRKMRKSFLKCR